MPTPSPSTVLLDLRRLQRQSAEAGSVDALEALLAAAPPEVASPGCVAYLCADERWVGCEAASRLLWWLAGRRRRLCSEPLLEEALLPLVLAEEGYPRRCVPCLEQGLWLWEDEVASAKPPGLADEDRAATEEGSPRERLAWFSPLPPVRSGICDYSAALIPELARHFEIDVVADPATTPLPEGAKAVISIQDFDRRAQEYPYLLFQVGNSTLHLEHLSRLRHHAGAVVLHDFYLSHGVCAHEADAHLGGDVFERLYRSHGYQACWLRHHDDLNADDRAIWRYPCNLDPLQWASGVIVHSREAARLAEDFYGTSATSGWSEVPHLKRVSPTPVPARQAARAELELPQEAFVICSFGFLGVAKLSDRLLQGFLASSLAEDPSVIFVFAGSDAGNRSFRLQLGLAVADASRRGRLRAQVRFTGWIPGPAYQRYLEATDAAIQLRTSSRGETSGTALDCMGAGVPLVVNEHGSMRELPQSAVLRLSDHCSPQEIARALERLRQDEDLRDRLREASLAHVAAHHDPSRCALRYAEAIRAAGALRIRRQQWLEAATTAVERGADRVQVANALALLRPPRPRQRQLFLDVSVVARHDLGSGVQRVVRALSVQLLLHPPRGVRVELVRASDEGIGFHYARRFALELLGLPDRGWPEPPIHPQPGDLYLSLDLDQAGVVRQRPTYQLMRALGVSVHFVVHDLLPCLQPECFPPGAGDWHQAWLEVVTDCDGALCVSRSVAADLRQWLSERGRVGGVFAIEWFHHGSEFCAPTAQLDPEERKSLEAIPSGPTLLMVGTVEPRKGYLDVIEAATQLWEEGARFNLIIVGREGWTDLPQSARRTIPETVRRLRNHPLRDQRLFWFDSASDATLQGLYRRSDGLIGASYGEGFGIPLIEAARAGLPLLLRDLPVFREVSENKAAFFPEKADRTELAAAIATFLGSLQEGRLSAQLPAQSWRQSAAQVVHALGLVWQEAPDEAVPPRVSETSGPEDAGEAEVLAMSPLPSVLVVQRATSWGRRLRRLRDRLRRLKQGISWLRRLTPASLSGRARRLRGKWRRRVDGALTSALEPPALQVLEPSSMLESARPWLQDLERRRRSLATRADQG
ncbi:glycosyltransferase [Synechococcus sp. CBW1004]|uniref:glycosyltransferase n=1 Tax=Synechococcus sp. CBW1004 TaxID=1353136 RepID=UPI0018CCDD28|nr:glycosyltransferase [Synechococcus sp. CBW1004]QPN62534.1 glycosyltransferase [Synechococcus sp. CBW1004]